MTTKRKTTDATPAASEAIATAAETPKTNAAADTAPQGAATSNLPRPRLQAGKPIVITCPMSEEQATLQQELEARYARLRSEKIDPRIDNALAITSDGRKLALDARMLSANAKDDPNSKINALADNVYSIWRRTEASQGAQVVFADLGVKKTPWGFSAYGEIIAKLVNRGIPRSQIAAIGDAASASQKRVLLDKVGSGQVRVFLGSTQKMGGGANLPKRLVALHHLDCPWTPSAIKQREGHVPQTGHDDDEVAIYRYITEKSFDSFIWKALDTKASFIAQLMPGQSSSGALAVPGRDSEAEATHEDKWQQKVAEETRDNAKRVREPG